MSSHPVVESIDYSETFQRKAAKLPDAQRKELHALFSEILKPPIPGARRCHLVKRGAFHLWKADLFPNRSWQVGFFVEGTTAYFVALGTHKDLNRFVDRKGR